METIHLKAAIQKAFSNIGKKNGTAPLDYASNTYPVAHELFVSSALRSMANKRYDMAKEAAKSAGVIDEDEVSEGNEITTWSSPYFDVTLKQASASTTLDRTMLKNVLMRELNMKEDAAQAIIDKASKPRKGAVTIGFALKG